ncbi:hypothetical protein GGF37_001356, partial [Kickxella alabastrina]
VIVALGKAVRYLDALDIFSKGDLERVRKIIPGWMREYQKAEGSADDSSSINTGAGGNYDPLIAACTPLHLAVQCPRKDVIQTILDFDSPRVPVDAGDQNGMTALHLAAKAARRDVVRMLLRHGADDMLLDAQGNDALAYATEPDVAAAIQDHRLEEIQAATTRLFTLVRSGDHAGVQAMLDDAAQMARVNLAARDSKENGTLLHLAVQHGEAELARWAVTQGVDVFARDSQGHMAEHYAGDHAMRDLLSQAPMGSTRAAPSGSAPHLSGVLYKWTNYVGGWKSRWFALSGGVLSYYKSEADAADSCRGSINLRIAKIMLSKDKSQFEVHGKGSNKYRLKAESPAIAKQWVHLLNVSKQWALENTKKGKDDEDEVVSSGGMLKPPANFDSASKGKHHVRGASTSSRTSGIGSSSATGGSRPNVVPGSPLVSTASRQSTDETVASPAASILSNESDDELYILRENYLAQISDLRSQLFIQDRLLTGLDKMPPRDEASRSSPEEMAKYLDIATQTIAQSRSIVDSLEKGYRDTSAVWQVRLRKEQERIDMLADSLRTAVVSSQNLLESVRSKSKEIPTQNAAAVAAAAVAASGGVGISLNGAEIPPQDDSADEDDDDSDLDFADATDEFFDTAASIVSTNAGLRGSASRTSFSAVRSNRLSPSNSGSSSEVASIVNQEAASGAAAAAVGGAASAEVVAAGSTGEAEAAPQGEHDEHEGQEDQDALDFTALSGYSVPVKIRTSLPEITKGGPSLNLWSVISGAIGKDLSKISVPVFFNEPSSFLQRFTEDMEYCDLLEIATLMPRSEDRTLLVAGFAMSNYASTFGRVAKPFNPLLGETFEYVRRDKKYRALSEQVKHHPPISACWVEGKNYVYHADTNIKSKFNGGSLTVVPTGVCHVELKLPLEFLNSDEEKAAGKPKQAAKINEKEGYFTEHYTWNKLTTNVNGIMIANFWIEHVGDLDVKNHRTGDYTKITFMQSNWMGKNKFRVTGEALDRSGRAVYDIAGDWTSKLVAKPVGSSQLKNAESEAEDLAPPAAMDEASNANDAVKYAATNSLHAPRNKPFVLWKANPRQTECNTYHLTTYAMSLNDCPDELEPYLCPTDSRFRPDQRAMETGEYEIADKEKSRLENKQRGTRRRREQGELPEWKPRWFVEAFDEDSGESYWRFTDEYWTERQAAAKRLSAGEQSSKDKSTWTNVEDIF